MIALSGALSAARVNYVGFFGGRGRVLGVGRGLRCRALKNSIALLLRFRQFLFTMKTLESSAILSRLLAPIHFSISLNIILFSARAKNYFIINISRMQRIYRSVSLQVEHPRECYPVWFLIALFV